MEKKAGMRNNPTGIGGERSRFVRSSPIIPGKRPPPPRKLSPQQAEIWKDIVGQMPVGFFDPKVFPCLEMLCCHLATVDFLSQKIVLMQKILGAKKAGFSSTWEGKKKERELVNFVRVYNQSSHQAILLFNRLKIIRGTVNDTNFHGLQARANGAAGQGEASSYSLDS